MKIRSFIIFLILILASFIASRDLFKPGYFSMHDDLQVGRLYEMELCFRDGQIPCRWVPDMGYSYGYPLFNYYPPFPYYSAMVFRGLSFSFIDSTKILFILGFFVSAIFMYLLGRELWGELGGLVSSIFYLFAPYHSVDIYVRGAMNEFWALAWFPLIFWSVLKIVREKSKKYLAVLAVSYGLLLLTHNVMTMLFTPLIVAWGLLMIWFEKKDWKEKILELAIGGLWGVGLAAFFFLPVLFEQKYVHTETMLMGYFNYLAHFVGLKKMLFTRFWGYGSSGWLQESGMPFQVGLPQWPIAVLSVIVIIWQFLRRKAKLNKVSLYLFYSLIFIFSLFMVHPRSVFIWLRLSPLSYVQFPWRFLTLTIFGMSVLGGGLINLIKNKKWQLVFGTLLILLTVILNYSFFRVEKIIKITDAEKLFSTKGWNKLQTDAIFDYLPKTAYQPPGGPAPVRPEIKEGKAEVAEVSHGTNWYNFKINVFTIKEKTDAKVQIPIYDFPGWKVWVNGKLTKISHDNLLGLITVTVPEGEHQVKVMLTNTPVRMMGNWLSLISWGILIYITIKFTKRKILIVLNVKTQNSKPKLKSKNLKDLKI